MQMQLILLANIILSIGAIAGISVFASQNGDVFILSDTYGFYWFISTFSLLAGIIGYAYHKVNYVKQQFPQSEYGIYIMGVISLLFTVFWLAASASMTPVLRNCLQIKNIRYPEYKSISSARYLNNGAVSSALYLNDDESVSSKRYLNNGESVSSKRYLNNGAVSSALYLNNGAVSSKRYFNDGESVSSKRYFNDGESVSSKRYLNNGESVSSTRYLVSHNHTCNGQIITTTFGYSLFILWCVVSYLVAIKLFSRLQTTQNPESLEAKQTEQVQTQQIQQETEEIQQETEEIQQETEEIQQETEEIQTETEQVETEQVETEQVETEQVQTEQVQIELIQELDVLQNTVPVELFQPDIIQVA